MHIKLGCKRKYSNIQQHTSLLWNRAKEKYENIPACDAPVTAQQSADERICDRTETPKESAQKHDTQGENLLLRGSSFKAQQISDTFHFSTQNLFLCFSKNAFREEKQIRL